MVAWDKPRFCVKCRKQLPSFLISTDDYCDECMKGKFAEAEKQTKQYRQWTGNMDWEYDSRAFQKKLWQRMYENLISGQALIEIANEYQLSVNTVKRRVQQYCKEESLSTPSEAKTKEKRCLFCGRVIEGRAYKWCHRDDCEGYFGMYFSNSGYWMDEQFRLQRIKNAQKRLDRIRSRAKKWANDKEMKARYESDIANAKLELEILNGTIDPFDATCSVCDGRIKTSLLADSDYEDPKWICRNCVSGWIRDHQESVVQDVRNQRILCDIFGNRLYEQVKESTRIRKAEVEEYLAKRGKKIEINETIEGRNND